MAYDILTNAYYKDLNLKSYQTILNSADCSILTFSQLFSLSSSLPPFFFPTLTLFLKTTPILLFFHGCQLSGLHQDTHKKNQYQCPKCNKDSNDIGQKWLHTSLSEWMHLTKSGPFFTPLHILPEKPSEEINSSAEGSLIPTATHPSHLSRQHRYESVMNGSGIQPEQRKTLQRMETSIEGRDSSKVTHKKNDRQNGILPFIPPKIIKSLLKDSSIKGITRVSFGTALFYYGT